MPIEQEANGSAANDATSFLLDGGEPQSPGLGFQIKAVDKIWQLIGNGTASLVSVRSGFVSVGPELGNLGGSPAVRFIDHHLTLKLDMYKQGSGGFYQAIPDTVIQRRLSQVSPNLVADGVNIYLVTKAGRERIAFKNTNNEFIYDPASRVVTNAEELQRHLDLAAGIYKAYATAYYEVNDLSVPSDQLIFDGKFLEEQEALRNSESNSVRQGELPQGVIVAEKPDATFEDIGGQEKATAICKRFAEQLRYPEVFALQGSEPPRGILLFGPPGTGKTLLAKAIANGAEANFLHVDASDVAGQGLYGQSERDVRGIFDLAKKLSEADGKHVVIFIDEGDLLLPRAGGTGGGQRHEATGKTVSIFAQEMDGLVSSRKITVIISTNEPQNLDPRILSRMEESEEVPLPDQNGLQQILRIHLAKFNRKAHSEIFDDDINLDILSEKARRQGLSGRDIADVVALLARQRGQRQLTLIEEAIRQGRLQLPPDGDEKAFINGIAISIAKGDITEGEGFILPRATTEELGAVIDNAKSLLKARPERNIGFRQ
ncbi:ATP-binding protein [Candidatus Daviesbacteria bacterium]|nr:ATP-binding protein [Candidatus Daviesbacteria bacterium]